MCSTPTGGCAGACRRHHRLAAGGQSGWVGGRGRRTKVPAALVLCCLLPRPRSVAFSVLIFLACCNAFVDFAVDAHGVCTHAASVLLVCEPGGIGQIPAPGLWWSRGGRGAVWMTTLERHAAARGSSTLRGGRRRLINAVLDRDLPLYSLLLTPMPAAVSYRCIALPSIHVAPHRRG